MIANHSESIVRTMFTDGHPSEHYCRRITTEYQQSETARLRQARANARKDGNSRGRQQTMTDATKVSNLPTLIAYSVVKRTPTQSVNQAEWTKIGAAWPHRDGRGVTVRLTALPLDGQIYLRMPSEDNEDLRNAG